MVLTPSATDATCGASNGGASVSVTGGTTIYSYLWSTGATVDNITNVPAGNYCVTVTDANLCSSNICIAVNNLGSPTATISASTDVSCNGGNDGSATVTGSGGITPYTYLWCDGQTTDIANGLIAGTCTVSLTDDNGCLTTVSVIITEPTTLSATINSQTNVSCNGGSDGAADMFATGGTTPYTYLWSEGSPTTSISNVTAGNYTVTVTDSETCTATATVVITEPTALTATISSTTDALCNGNSDGAATVSASGGTSPYTYSWSLGGIGSTESNLSVGSYDVTVTDIKGCEATTTATIGEPSAIIITPSNTDATCGSANGGASVTVSGGTSGYTYLWSTGATTDNITNVPAGNYCVTVSDANGCSSNICIAVNNIGAPTVSITVNSNVSCFGGNDGSATISGIGGVTPYSFEWSDGQLTATASGLLAGIYTASLTDANSCVSSANVTITEPTVLSATITSQTNVSCNGGNNGATDITISGGTSPYTYLWSNASTTEDLTNLSIGIYDLTVTDANSCTETISVTITEPNALVLSEVHTDVSCNGGNNGSIDLTVTGGVSSYTYSWTNFETIEDLSGLSAGTYDVTVTDDNGCTANTSIIIIEPTALSSTISGTNETIADSCDGTATVTPSGGTSPYTFNWDAASQTTQTANNLCVGVYSVTVIDNNNCTQVLSIEIFGPGALVLNTTGDTVLCNGNCNGSVSVTVSGGVSPFSYLWSDGQPTQAATGLCAGTYTVTVTDANGATKTAIAIVAEPTQLIASISGTTETLCNGSSDGTATVGATGGTSPYTYLWQTSGNTGSTESGLNAGNHDVTVTDANGCTSVVTATITEPVLLTATVTVTDALCNGVSNGTATANPSGGTPTYTYLWDVAAFNQITQIANSLPAGTYSVTVTDYNGCTFDTTGILSEPSLTTVTTSVINDVSCNGGSDGSATVSATGGTSPYTYLWDAAGQTNDTAINLSASNYAVSVYDNNLCLSIGSISISQPNVLNGTITNVSSHCELADGSATVTPSGGTSSYTYFMYGYCIYNN